MKQQLYLFFDFEESSPPGGNDPGAAFNPSSCNLRPANDLRTLGIPP
jgi:hypothetical protein